MAVINQSYVYKKEVDWSTLHQGVSIPVSIQVVFQSNIQNFIGRGQSRDIFIVLDGNTYKAKLVNQAFDTKRYPNHNDILQIRYNSESDIAVRLRDIYIASYSYISGLRGESNSQKRHIKLSKDKQEFLAIYTTEYKDTHIFDCITSESNRGNDSLN